MQWPRSAGPLGNSKQAGGPSWLAASWENESSPVEWKPNQMLKPTEACSNARAKKIQKAGLQSNAESQARLVFGLACLGHLASQIQHARRRCGKPARHQEPKPSSAACNQMPKAKLGLYLASLASATSRAKFSTPGEDVESRLAIRS